LEIDTWIHQKRSITVKKTSNRDCPFGQHRVPRVGFGLVCVVFVSTTCPEADIEDNPVVGINQVHSKEGPRSW